MTPLQLLLLINTPQRGMSVSVGVCVCVCVCVNYVWIWGGVCGVTLTVVFLVGVIVEAAAGLELEGANPGEQTFLEPLCNDSEND